MVLNDGNDHVFFGSVFSSFWRGQKKHKKNRQRVLFFKLHVFFWIKFVGGVFVWKASLRWVVFLSQKKKSFEDARHVQKRNIVEVFPISMHFCITRLCGTLSKPYLLPGYLMFLLIHAEIYGKCLPFGEHLYGLTVEKQTSCFISTKFHQSWRSPRVTIFEKSCVVWNLGCLLVAGEHHVWFARRKVATKKHFLLQTNRRFKRHLSVKHQDVDYHLTSPTQTIKQLSISNINFDQTKRNKANNQTSP